MRPTRPVVLLAVLAASLASAQSVVVQYGNYAPTGGGIAIYTPPTQGPAVGLAVFLRGGGWGVGSWGQPGTEGKSFNQVSYEEMLTNEPNLKGLRDQGYATLNVNYEEWNRPTCYRQFGGCGFPFNHYDVVQVLASVQRGRAWVPDSVGQQHLWQQMQAAAQRDFILLGGSAGGNVALLAALQLLRETGNTAAPRLRCVVDLAGPAELRGYESRLTDYAQASPLFGSHNVLFPMTVPQIVSMMSPITQVYGVPNLASVRWIFVRSSTDVVVTHDMIDPMIDRLNQVAGSKVASYHAYTNFDFTSVGFPPANGGHGLAWGAEPWVYSAAPYHCAAPLNPAIP